MLLDKPPMSDTEAEAVGTLLQAYKRSLVDDLSRASDGDRVFVIITAPTGRPGSAHLCTDMRFIHHGTLLTELLGLLSRTYGDPILLDVGNADE